VTATIPPPIAETVCETHGVRGCGIRVHSGTAAEAAAQGSVDGYDGRESREADWVGAARAAYAANYDRYFRGQLAMF
jgi:hypothetical protein